MSALKGPAIEAFIRKRDPEIAAVLVYGPDEGLVHERADAIARSVTPDFKDPFNYIELSDVDLKASPSRLADEAVALSFAGGGRVVRIRTAGETAATAAATLIKGLDGGWLSPNAITIVEAGDLSKKSGLRKTFEAARRAAALPCYTDGPREVRALAEACARAEGLVFSPEAIEIVVTLLGGDRGVSRTEIDKLILFKGLASARTGPDAISVEDVRAVLSDGVGEATDEAAAAAADGDARALSAALYRSAVAGASPISLLRALQRTLQRVLDARAEIARGANLREAMNRLRPPVFFAEQRRFETRLGRWTQVALERGLDAVLDAELAAKSTGAPQREIAERAAFLVASLARR